MPAQTDDGHTAELRRCPASRPAAPGLDDILGGGLDANRLYLYEGRPAPARRPLPCNSCWTGSAMASGAVHHPVGDRRELRLVAKRHGWSLGVEVFELVPPETTLDPSRELTVFHPAEMELNETTKSDLRPGGGAEPHARRLRQPVGTSPASPEPAALPPPGSGAEALLHQPRLHSRPARRPDVGAGRPPAPLDRAWGRAPGAARASITAPSGGGCASSRCAACNFAAASTTSPSSPAGSTSIPGWSPPSITGLSGRVTPQAATRSSMACSAAGWSAGPTSCCIGAAGVGKSTLALTYAIAAAERGERPSSSPSTRARRPSSPAHGRSACRWSSAIEDGLIRIQQIDPAELSPGEFAAIVQEASSRRAPGSSSSTA